MEENNLIGRPGHVYNMDVTGLRLNNKPSSVLAIKRFKNATSITSCEKEETISVLACVNGEGSLLPPYSIMKGKTLKQEFMDGMPPGSVLRMSQTSAYVNSKIFLDWLKTHITPRKPGGEMLIILDGHTSHTTYMEVFEFGEQHDITLLSLPPHTSHWLQPHVRSLLFQIVEERATSLIPVKHSWLPILVGRLTVFSSENFLTQHGLYQQVLKMV